MSRARRERKERQRGRPAKTRLARLAEDAARRLVPRLRFPTDVPIGVAWAKTDFSALEIRVLKQLEKPSHLYHVTTGRLPSKPVNFGCSR